MRDITRIKNLIKNRVFDDAERGVKKILESTKSQKVRAECYFWLGEIYNSYENAKHDCNKARDYYHMAIQDDINTPNAYYNFAVCEKDPIVALNYLRIGYKKFPESPLLFRKLFAAEDNDAKNLLIAKCLKERNITSTDYLNIVVGHLWSCERWNDLSKILSKIQISESDKLIKIDTDFLLGCVYLFKKSNYKKAINLLKNIIASDLDNRLLYSHYLALTCAYEALGKHKEAVRFFDKITFSCIFSDNLFGWDSVYFIPAYSIYNPMYTLLAELLKNDEYRHAKVKCLAACSNIEDYEYRHCDLKNAIADLEKFLSIEYSVDAARYLFAAYRLNNKNLQAWNVLLEMTKHGASESIHGCVKETLSAFSDTELKHVVDDILNTQNISLIYVYNIIDHVISELCKINNYDDVKKICHVVNEKVLLKSRELFKIAYSLCHSGDTPLGKRVYLHILHEDPKNFSVLNNLGVIFENEGDYNSAYEYYQRAYQIVSNDELIHNNMFRTSKKCENLKKQYEAFKSFPPEFRRKFLEISECADEKRFLCRSDIAQKTGLPESDVFSIWATSLDNGFIEKIPDGKNTKFRINFRIVEYLRSNKEFLRSNIDYESIPQRLNVDTLQQIGYDNNLKQRLQNIPSGARTILERDLKECAISLMVGSFKSAILVAGSAIEYILLYILKKNNITRYDIGSIIKKKPETKDVERMNLGELLEVALANKLIRQESYHLSQFARQYRNAIHPGKEMKIASEVNNDTAMMLWRTLLSLVNNYL